MKRFILEKMLIIGALLFVLQTNVDATQTILTNSEDISLNHLPVKRMQRAWTIIVFIEASIDFNKNALANVVHMVQEQVQDDCNVVIQWHAGGQTAWRFVADYKSLIPVDWTTVSCNMADDIVNCVQWAVCFAPADKYALILCSHGCGILDPISNSIAADYCNNDDSTTTTNYSPILSKAIGNDMLLDPEYLHIPYDDTLHDCRLLDHRGICFRAIEKINNDNAMHIYLTHEEMVHCMARIRNDILNGKKLDILGMDACGMAMLEIAYQIKESVVYMTGSQDCEMADGYDYAAWISSFCAGNVDAQHCAESIVATFGNYYASRQQVDRYTQSAINVSYSEQLVQSLDALVNSFFVWTKCYDEKEIKACVHNARKSCLSFCLNPCYTDLYAVCQAFLTVAQNIEEESKTCTESEFTQEFILLKENIKRTQFFIDQMVIANAAGAASEQAKGISIYFPLSSIDQSYGRTAFAQNSQWFEFLQWIVA